MVQACATCASAYHDPQAPIAEKPLLPGRQLECCGRSICARCLNQNKRYETYCPYCQITTHPSILPQGLRDPPAYTSLQNNHSPASQSQPLDDRYNTHDRPPAYTPLSTHNTSSEKSPLHEPAPDVLHFLTPSDSILSLSMAYNVPITALRKANNVFSDHLLPGRRTVIIPGEYYKNGISLSPRPIEGEEEEAKKNKVRRWMVACKVAEYDVALLYLQQADWTLDAAVEAYREDERWEKEHSLQAKERHKHGKTAQRAGMRRFVGNSMNGT
ncbi:Hypothetical protein R9X50_00642500 [Acrodontium crateriforme]|uniref:RING-type domain-containing protein n=1 Tax=Acrodontium crateriforme TaxID=150365 RepID=A0AAQ3M9N1_9PEZI|nr:Hypothetical protein R9X50_00642500 [Acrodontium crateriforme]